MMPAQRKVSQKSTGLRLPSSLKDGIKQCAEKEQRSASNWMRIALEQAVESRLGAKH